MIFFNKNSYPQWISIGSFHFACTVLLLVSISGCTTIVQTSRSGDNLLSQSTSSAAQSPESQENKQQDYDYNTNNGITQLKKQQYNQALSSFTTALSFARNSGTRSSEALVLNYIGAAYEMLGEIESARNYYTQSLKIRQEVHDQKGEAKTLANLASTYRSQGQYMLALQLYQDAEKLLTGLKPLPLNDIAPLHLHMGVLYSELGQHEKSHALYQQALVAYKEIDDQSGIAFTFHNIGNIYIDLKKYQAAIQSFEQALAIHEKQKNHLRRAETLNSIGFTWNKLEQSDKAINALTEALSLSQRLTTRKLTSAILDSLGDVYRRLGNYPEALNFYNQSLVIWQEINDRENARITLGNIAATFEKQNKIEAAIIFYKQSINITEKIRSELKSLSIAEQRAYADRIQEIYRNLANLLLQKDRVLEAQQVLDLLKIQEIEDYLGSVRSNQKTTTGTPLLPAETEIEQHYAKLIQQAIPIGIELKQLHSIDKSNRTDKQKQRLETLIEEERSIHEAFMKFTERPDIKAIVNQLNDANLRPSSLVTLEDNLERLGKGFVILYPLILEDRLELVLVTSVSSPIRRTIQVKRSELTEATLAFRNSLINKSQDVTKHAKIFYDWIIKPFEEQLQQIGATTILYAPDGALRYIPLAAFYDGNQWLVQKFKINNITSQSLIEIGTKRSENPKILTAAFIHGHYKFEIGNQSFEFNGLRFAEKEVRNIKTLFEKVTDMPDKDFNSGAIFSQLSEHNIIHLATHAALVPGNLSQSFILSGNGEPITIDQIKYNWSLTNVDLFALSACNTAIGGIIGKGEEILGFGYLMESKGAKSTLASLWPVDDNGTQMLMSIFYQQLKQSNKTTKTEALQIAQKTLIDGKITEPEKKISESSEHQRGESLQSPGVTNRLSHPYYWAPFILIGNGS